MFTNLAFPNIFLSSTDTPTAGEPERKYSFNSSAPNNSSKPPYDRIELYNIKLDTVLEVYKTIRPYLTSGEALPKKDPRIKRNYFYKIKLADNLQPQEFFGLLDNAYPEEDGDEIRGTDLKKATSFHFLFPQLESQPLKVTLKSPEIDFKQIEKTEVSRLILPCYLDPADAGLFNNGMDLFRQNGFEPKFYYPAEPRQFPPTHIADEKVPWIIIVSSAWIAKMNETSQDNVFSKIKLLMQQENHLVVNYRSPEKDFDLNRQFNIIPPQWEEHSIYDSFDIKSTLKIISKGLTEKLFPLSLKRLAK